MLSSELFYMYKHINALKLQNWNNWINTFRDVTALVLLLRTVMQHWLNPADGSWWLDHVIIMSTYSSESPKQKKNLPFLQSWSICRYFGVTNGTSFILKLLIQISVFVYGKCNPSEGLQIRSEVPVPLPGRWLQCEGLLVHKGERASVRSDSLKHFLAHSFFLPLIISPCTSVAQLLWWVLAESYVVKPEKGAGDLVWPWHIGGARTL